LANERGQHYHGPVVLITDARCYSATDIFAAGFQDHGIGHILGVDGNTGAGGANVWTHELLKLLMELPEPADPDTPFDDLPNGANMRVAIRRTLRVGGQAGTPLEDLGVKPDSRRRLTRNDLLNGNADLIDRAGEILAGMPVRGLTASVAFTRGGMEVNAETLGIDRLDIYVDGRPDASVDVADGQHTIPVNAAGGNVMRIEGFEGGVLVASRRLQL
jgi:hypothetical protein